ncbi:MAG TPA: GNAT family protein [Anaerolineaceae bacterium]|jgi:RimJ/RimL family protein N-acetyltransferase|nr:GNAT family N-acetyltransferase [Anaerolineaceae bacterium]HUM49177.1 GNAT family protein [Anaerolineaceae bacterium]
MTIEYGRIILRPLQEIDLVKFSQYRSDREVARFQSWSAPYSLAQGRELLTRMLGNPMGTPGEWFSFAIILEEQGVLIGDCAFQILANDGLQAQFGITLSREFQGKGYAFEAITALFSFLFDRFNLHRIFAVCDVKNIASYTLLERVGMRREATFVENIFFKGEWGSEYLYALLDREWKNR